MRRKPCGIAMGEVLTFVAAFLTLVSSAWAQPKFQVLHGVAGGLFQGVTFDAKGNLYSVTNGGGDHNAGSVFELTPGTHGWNLSTLQSFSGEDGVTPNGGLIFDAAGNLYGTAENSTAVGIVFELDPTIDTARISARVDQGVLTLTLPKAESVKPRKITVE